MLIAELGVDYVRGTLKDTGEFLPRMPPFRGRVGLRYQRNAFQAGGEVRAWRGRTACRASKRRPTATGC